MRSAPEETRTVAAGGDGWAELDGSLRAVAVEVLRHGPLPRAELSRRLGLSPGSLTRLTRPLLDAGLLVEGGPRLQARTGRPSVPLDVRTGRERFAGVKVTGDELFAVLTDLRARVLDRHATALPGRSVDDVVGCAEAAVRGLAGGGRLDGIGIGIGGAVPDHRTVSRAPFLGWGEVPLAASLRAATGVPVAVDNDVRALTAAEHWFGRGRGLHSFALVTIGAGVGCGIVVHDRQVCGARGLAGAVAHRPVPGLGVACPEGHRDCASAALTTAALRAAARERLGAELDPGELHRRAAAGDPAARALCDDAVRALARVVGGIVALADPEAVLVSGEGVGLLEVARPAFDDALAAEAGGPPVPVQAVPFGFPDWARGAAVVAVQERVLGRSA